LALPEIPDKWWFRGGVPLIGLGIFLVTSWVDRAQKVQYIQDAEKGQSRFEKTIQDNIGIFENNAQGREARLERELESEKEQIVRLETQIKSMKFERCNERHGEFDFERLTCSDHH
jgi:hypothetical protein